MKSLSIDEIKMIQLNILKFIDKVCAENGLRYFLCGGTLIGAVRHKGYIPWDDDIDINMPANDYMKLKRILKNSNRYKLLTGDNEDYYYSFGKLVDSNTILIENDVKRQIPDMGIFIDIFPLVGLPQDANEAKEFFGKAMELRKGLAMYANNGKLGSRHPIKQLKHKLKWHHYRSMGMDKIRREITKMSSMYDYDESVYVCSIGGAYFEKEIYPRSYFDDAIRVKFEDFDALIPKEYDAFLTQMYGEYMKLPPVEQREGHHHIEAYWKDESR